MQFIDIHRVLTWEFLMSFTQGCSPSCTTIHATMSPEISALKGVSPIGKYRTSIICKHSCISSSYLRVLILIDKILNKFIDIELLPERSWWLLQKGAAPRVPPLAPRYHLTCRWRVPPPQAGTTSAWLRSTHQHQCRTAHAPSSLPEPYTCIYKCTHI